MLDNGGRTDCTVWGDILTAVAHQRGIAGTVIDGVSRDVRRALELGYPIYSRGRFMRTGKDRVEVAEVGGPVTIGGVQVAPGDLLVGDDDGVVAIAATASRRGDRHRARDRGARAGDRDRGARAARRSPRRARSTATTSSSGTTR